MLARPYFRKRRFAYTLLRRWLLKFRIKRREARKLLFQLGDSPLSSLGTGDSGRLHRLRTSLTSTSSQFSLGDPPSDFGGEDGDTVPSSSFRAVGAGDNADLALGAGVRRLMSRGGNYVSTSSRLLVPSPVLETHPEVEDDTR